MFQVPVTESTATLTIFFQGFQNNFERLFDGQCCDTACDSGCDLLYRICFNDRWALPYIVFLMQFIIPCVVSCAFLDRICMHASLQISIVSIQKSSSEVIMTLSAQPVYGMNKTLGVGCMHNLRTFLFGVLESGVLLSSHLEEAI